MANKTSQIVFKRKVHGTWKTLVTYVETAKKGQIEARLRAKNKARILSK